MSLEQSPDFLLLKRILRVIAPHYVLYTSPSLPPDTTLLDKEHSYISVSEATEVVVAIAAVLFHIARLRFSHTNIFESVNPDHIAAELHKIDKRSARHAVKLYLMYWPETDPKQARELVSRYVIGSSKWREHILSLHVTP